MSWLSKLTGGGASKTTATVGGKEIPRPSSPPKVIVDHHEYIPEEFVIGSFRVRPYEGDLIAKQQFDFRVAFKLGEDDVEFICRGLVVKSDAQAGLVARYSRPQPFYEKKLIDYLRAWKGV
jgi:hypothetical protein